MTPFITDAVVVTMNGVFGATLGPDGLEIANLSALTIKSETGVPLIAVDAKPKPDT